LLLTTLTLLLSAQLVEVPLHRFNKLAEPRGIAAVALSPNAHVVSVWTRWSDQTPCVLWTLDVQTGETEGRGENDCPKPSPTTSHPVEKIDAQLSERLLTFSSRTEKKQLTSFGHEGFSVKGVAASDGEWLLWTQNAAGADHLYLADGAELTANPAQKPSVRSVPIVHLPASFGWKKDTKATPGSVCDFFERGVMITSDTLFLDWSANSKPIDVRVKGQGGQLQKWQVDVGSATPVPGLQVERMELKKQGRWRLRIHFPYALEAIAITPGGAKVPRLSPLEAPMSTTSTEPHCIYVDGQLKPERFMLDAQLR
jgi:hypothetical protein